MGHGQAFSGGLHPVSNAGLVILSGGLRLTTGRNPASGSWDGEGRAGLEACFHSRGQRQVRQADGHLGQDQPPDGATFSLLCWRRTGRPMEDATEAEVRGLYDQLGAGGGGEGGIGQYQINIRL